MIGNIIGIFISPALLTFMVGQSSNGGAYVGVIKQLCYTVIAPLVVGQIFQKLLPKAVKWLQSKIQFGNVSNVMILLLVWSTFCETFYSKQTADAGSIIVILIAMVITFFLFSALCLSLCFIPFIARALQIERPDAVAITICGATKTIALGIPVITVIYGSDPDVGLLVVPLITYHAVQCILGALMLPKLKAWVLSEIKEEKDQDLAVKVVDKAPFTLNISDQDKKDNPIGLRKEELSEVSDVEVAR